MPEVVWEPGPVLGLETSCDETAAAVFDPSPGSRGVLSDVTASQASLHSKHGGVVPELASRQHLEDVRPVVEEALRQAGVGLSDLAGIAVTAGPGLMGALLVGTSFAKSLALARRGLPLAGVHHLEGHVRAAFLEHEEPEGPYLALVVSGGHTSLIRVERLGLRRTYTTLARTLDDAAGEAYDKVGKLVGLGYPAGPVIDRLARGFSGSVVHFAAARVKEDGGRSVNRRAFSFSGIKTAVKLHLERTGVPKLQPGQDPRERLDLLAVLAGFQEAVVGMLVRPTLRVACEEGLHHVLAVGGVSANSLLRERLALDCARLGLEFLVPAPRWSVDNGAMIAAAGAQRLAAGLHDGQNLAPDPALSLEGKP